jgi:octaheme c-type cytochrome (tetrathionate reductase family)
MNQRHNPSPNNLMYATCLMVILLLGGISTAFASTADHGKFEELNKDFSSGPQVTKACLHCHTEAAKQIHKTKHWTWEFLNPDNKQRLGKRNVLNNFCITPRSNYPYCTACHIGYGWKDDNFDFASEENVDCLACHDTTGDYNKPPGKAGNPADYVDLKKTAQKVGKTSRDTCGNCHFYGGGGNGVKHGDMDSSLAMPDEELDVHMDAVGLDFTCATCHATSSHQVPGSRYAPTAAETKGIQVRGKPEVRNPATCRSCHGTSPHDASEIIGIKLNGHTDEVACQTCHIPTIARGGVATKLSWDWSTAGKLTEEGKPLETKDKHGHVIYSGKKGDFVYGENIQPEYFWFNGKVKYTLLGDKVDKTNGVTQINRFEGSPDDGKSRIWPVKVMRGKQPYDPVNRTLVAPHTVARDADDDTAYWKNYDWGKSISDGMKNVGAPFSGKYDFIETTMMWPITHMVAPARNALQCSECHSQQGRLQGLPGIYLPGTGSSPWIDRLGLLAILAVLAGIFIHASLRIISARRRKA